MSAFDNADGEIYWHGIKKQIPRYLGSVLFSPLLLSGKTLLTYLALSLGCFYSLPAGVLSPCLRLVLLGVGQLHLFLLQRHSSSVVWSSIVIGCPLCLTIPPAKDIRCTFYRYSLIFFHQPTPTSRVHEMGLCSEFHESLPNIWGSLKCFCGHHLKESCWQKR